MMDKKAVELQKAIAGGNKEVIKKALNDYCGMDITSDAELEVRKDKKTKSNKKGD